MGGMRGSSLTNVNLRRIAVSIRAIDRPAVFIVPMRNRFSATSAKSRNGPARSANVSVPRPPGSGRNPSKKSS